MTNSARVLIADADEQMRAIYRKGLVDYGYDVATAVDGLDCIRALRDFVPELLVLDPELPWGGGAGVLARMHEEIDLPYLPVILLAADPGPWLHERFAAFPNCACHVKPMAPSMLAYQIQLSLQEPFPPRRLGGARRMPELPCGS
jgi:CheY-like chemotaxis protein